VRDDRVMGPLTGALLMRLPGDGAVKHAKQHVIEVESRKKRIRLIPDPTTRSPDKPLCLTGVPRGVRGKDCNLTECVGRPNGRDMTLSGPRLRSEFIRLFEQNPLDTVTKTMLLDTLRVTDHALQPLLRELTVYNRHARAYTLQKDPRQR
jgi:hypothetical protein